MLPDSASTVPEMDAVPAALAAVGAATASSEPNRTVVTTMAVFLAREKRMFLSLAAPVGGARLQWIMIVTFSRSPEAAASPKSLEHAKSALVVGRTPLFRRAPRSS